MDDGWWMADRFTHPCVGSRTGFRKVDVERIPVSVHGSGRERVGGFRGEGSGDADRAGSQSLDSTSTLVEY